MKSKVLENKRMKQEALTNSAFNLLIQKDIHEITISDIAKDAGVAKGTFYLYFKDKYHICDYVVQKESEKLFLKAHEALVASDIENFEDRMVFWINQVIMQLEENPVILRFVQKNFTWGLFRVKDQQYEIIEEYNITKEFEIEARKKGFRYDNPAITLYTLIELVASTCYGCILFSQPMSMDDYRPYLFEAIYAILRAAKREIKE
ncbi:MAG: TetR/AcrR family transcriptional regulator [Holdemanella sp.]|nr:TetR/AcrR family transcriptional regulator [Holdemanella sp.]